MSRVQAGGLVLLVLLAAAPMAATATDGGTVSEERAANAAVAADHVEFRITVHENASARWTFTYTRVFQNDTERERFEAFAAEFNTNDTPTYRQFRDQATALAAAGRNTTDREMQATAFSRSAELGGDCLTAEDCGSVRMSFLWTGFAVEDGDRLVVADVFGSGLYISTNQQLVFETGPGLDFASAAPDTYTPSGTTLAGSDSITYEGEQTFSDRRPRVVFEPAPTGGDGTPTGRTVGTASPAPAGDLPLALLGGFLVLLVGAGAALVWWRDGAGTPMGADDDAPSGGGATAASAGAAAGAPAVPDEELLTDEDRVLQLLDDNGGRMKQVAIVEETGWSKSKVSMLLSEMADDDQISKLRVGRENIVSLSGHEPEAARSPHEED